MLWRNEQSHRRLEGEQNGTTPVESNTYQSTGTLIILPSNPTSGNRSYRYSRKCTIRNYRHSRLFTAALFCPTKDWT